MKNEASKFICIKRMIIAILGIFPVTALPAQSTVTRETVLY